MNITEKTKVKQVGNIDIADLDGEKVMMDMEKGKYLMLNEVATRIWDIVEEVKSIDEIINILLEEYEIEKKTCEEQVVTFIQQLVDSNLLSIE